MIARPSRTWLYAVLCLLVFFAAVAWISVTVLRLDASERAMRQQAVIEENVRLALWRMDAAIAPILARESVRPVAEYDRGVARVEHVRLYFQLDGRGWMSPSKSPLVAELDRRIAPTRLARALRDEVSSAPGTGLPGAGAGAGVGTGAGPATAMVLDEGKMGRPVPQQRAGNRRPFAQQVDPQMQRSSAEWEMRSQSIANAYQQNVYGAAQASNPSKPASRGDPDLQTIDNTGEEATLAMTARWIDGELFLLREIDRQGHTLVQGCWMDWPEMQRWLRDAIADLLPDATLAPAPAPAPAHDLAPDSARDPDQAIDRTRLLASLPIVLEAGAVPYSDPTGSPVISILILVWCAVLVAAIAVVALVRGISALSERRAAFVAAVTHELRTPLTTLQTYSEMLADGKITEPGQQARYVTTLHREALRLGHLVDNVLSYSRIERGATGVRREPVDARALLARVEERLAARTGAASMQLDIELPPGSQPITLLGDDTAIEQILFNLIDNACKYAAAASDRRVVVSVQAGVGTIDVRVRDHGPGIPASVARSLFKPFSKSVERAAVSAPGVGLGLALCRRLARAMGGDLRVDATVSQGTCLVLCLRAARTAR